MVTLCSIANTDRERSSPRAIAGNVLDSLLTIMGNAAGIGLGTFTAQAMVQNSTFQVTDGNVTSFTIGKFLDSRLYVGFRPNSAMSELAWESRLRKRESWAANDNPYLHPPQAVRRLSAGERLSEEDDSRLAAAKPPQ